MSDAILDMHDFWTMADKIDAENNMAAFIDKAQDVKSVFKHAWLLTMVYNTGFSFTLAGITVVIPDVGEGVSSIEARWEAERAKAIPGEQLTIETWPGSHIDQACQCASNLARLKNSPVCFDFNGANVVVAPGGEPVENIRQRWRDEMTSQHNEWNNSKEGRAYWRNQKATLRRRQKRHDVLMERLPLVIFDSNALVNWCVQFSRPTDYIGVKTDLTSVVNMIEWAGWKPDAHIETEGETGMKQWLGTNKGAMAQYIIGQALSCMHRGYGPHPIINKFSKEYRKMKGTA